MTDQDDSKYPERMRPGLPHRQQKLDADRRLISIELPPDTLNRMDAVLEPGETREDSPQPRTKSRDARPREGSATNDRRRR